MSDSQQHDAAVPWLAGLRFERSRRLSADEQQEARSRHASTLLQVTGLFVLDLAVIASLSLMLAYLGGEPSVLRTSLGMVALVVTVGIVGATARPISTFVKNAIAYTRDVQTGVVNRYSGELRNLPADSNQAVLVEEGLLDPYQERMQWIDVFPLSGLVFKTSSRTPTALIWVASGLVELAKPRSASPEAASLTGYSTSDSNNGYEVLRREITAPEGAELGRQIDRLRRQRRLQLILLTLWSGFGIFAWASMSREWTLYQSISFVSVLIWTVQTYSFYVPRFRLAGKLSRDLNQRVMLVLTAQDDQATGGDGGRLLAEVEVLPNARRIWRVNGEPSAWRISNELGPELDT